MVKCPECPQTPKIENCQSCYLAEKMRRERLSGIVTKLLYQIDQFMDAVKKI